MLYRLVVRSIVLGFLVACGACIALAGEPGFAQRPVAGSRGGGLPEIVRETQTYVAEPAGVPQDLAMFEAQNRHEIRLKELELQERRLQHEQSLDYKRLELQREREQLRYALRGYSPYSRRPYGDSASSYSHYAYPSAMYQADYYPAYTPPPVPYYGTASYQHTRAYRPIHHQDYDYYGHRDRGRGCGIGIDFGLHLGR